MELDEDSERSEAWDLLATQSIASPYPLLLRGHLVGITRERKIRRENATPTRCATPLSRPPYGISPIGRTLRAASSGPLPAGCSPRRRNTAKYFHLSTYSCPHHYLNFDDDYLTAKAADTLVVLPTAVGAALMLYETAVQANPFNARNFAGASLLSVQNGDSVKAAYYLNEGLLIDPENKGLQTLLNVWKGGHK